MTEKTIFHTIPPLFDKNSRVLLLGSLPSPKSREQGFFYGHPQNRFWKVLASVFEADVPQTIEEKKRLCTENHVALWDVIRQCDIRGAADSTIKNVVPNDIGCILSRAPIGTIYATGTKSAALYRKYLEPELGRTIVQLPSTSPANAAWSIERLVEAYRVIRQEIL